MNTKKQSQANLMLYAFLGLLFGLAATIDIAGISAQAMENQAERTEATLRNWGL